MAPKHPAVAAAAAARPAAAAAAAAPPAAAATAAAPPAAAAVAANLPAAAAKAAALPAAENDEVEEGEVDDDVDPETRQKQQRQQESILEKLEAVQDAVLKLTRASGRRLSHVTRGLLKTGLGMERRLLYALQELKLDDEADEADGISPSHAHAAAEAISRSSADILASLVVCGPSAAESPGGLLDLGCSLLEEAAGFYGEGVRGLSGAVELLVRVTAPNAEQFLRVWRLMRDCPLSQEHMTMLLGVAAGVGASSAQLAECFRQLNSSLDTQRKFAGCDSSSREFGQALQLLVEAFVQAWDVQPAGASQAFHQNVSAVVEICCDLSIVPVALVARLLHECELYSCSRIHSWWGMAGVLSPLAKMGVAMSADPASLQQMGALLPLAFCVDWLERALQLMKLDLAASDAAAAAAAAGVEKPDRSAYCPAPDVCSKLCHNLAYLNLPLAPGAVPDLDGKVKEVFLHLLRHSQSRKGSISSRHQLWQAVQLARSVWGWGEEIDAVLDKEDVDALQKARRAAIADAKHAEWEEEVADAARRLLGEKAAIVKHPGLLHARAEVWLPHKLPYPVLWDVDAVVIMQDGTVVVLEADGQTHRFGPHGSLSGSTVWRNTLLRALGYKLVMVDSEAWRACSSEEEQCQLLKELLATVGIKF